MTIVLPIKFRDGDIPNLSIEKTNDGITPNNLNLIQVKGNLQSEEIVSLYDGTLELMILPGQTMIPQFFLEKGTDDTSKDADGINFLTPIIPEIDTSKAIKFNETYSRIQVHKGEPIGRIASSSIGLMGLHPSQESIDLATSSQGKAITIK